MASLQVTLLLLLSSLLQLPAYVRLGDQDDAVQAAQRLPEDGGSQPAGRRHWVWDSAGVGGADFSTFVRAKREAEGEASSRSAAEDTTAAPAEAFSTTTTQHSADESEVSFTADWLYSSSEEGLLEDNTVTEKPLSVAGSDNVSTDTSGVGKLSHLGLSTEEAPVEEFSEVDSEAMVTAEEEITRDGRENRERRSTVESGIGKGLWATSPPSPTAPLPESSGISTAAPVDKLASMKHGPSVLGTTRSPRTPSASGSVTGIGPLLKTHNHTSILVGKCLLAVFILALVAAIFIICTAVLATLLWRQKHADRKHQCSSTEMVCISALLPDSEPVANGEKPSKVKRMKLPTDNISETEGDNVTLSSFLPDH